MIAGAEVDQLPAQIHANTRWLHMARDALCQEYALEAVIQRDHGPLPGILKEPAIGNGHLQCTGSPFNQQCLATAESCPDTQSMWYGMQAACSLEARRQTGVVQSLFRYSRAQILVENNPLDRRGEVSQKREALNCDLKVLGRSAAEICHKSLPIFVEIPDWPHRALSLPSSDLIAGHKLYDNGISSPAQDLDLDETSQCPPLVSDSEDELEYSDFETDNWRTWYTSKYSEGCLVMASTLAASLLVHNEGNVGGSKKDQRQSHAQSKGSKGDSTRDSQDDHSSCSSRTSTSTKRNYHHCNGDQDSMDGSGDDGRKRQRRVPHATDDGVHGAVRLLACPFYKYDRRRYSEFNHLEKEYRGCSSIYVTSISRLKQHLYRVHAQPENYCSSCYEVFESRSQLDSHVRRRPPCEIATPMFTEKITDQQSIQLKKKQYGKTTAEKWYSIFRILFPKAQLPESPYLEDSQQVGVRSYLSLYQELIQPRLMQELGLDEGGRQAVNSVLEQSTSQVLQHLAQERVPRATEGPNQERPHQSGCTSYQTNQLLGSDCLDTGTHAGNSPNTSELSLPEAWCLGPYEAANSLQHSTFDNVIQSGDFSADLSWFGPPTQSFIDIFAEPADNGLDIPQDLAQYTQLRFDSQDLLDDAPMPAIAYSN